MSLPFFSKSNNNTDPNRFLTATITSDAVKVLAFYQDNGNLKIIGSYKQPLESNLVRSGSIVSSEEVAEALANACVKATQDLEQNIDNIIFGISGDLCIGITTIIRAKRGKTAAINEKEIEDLYSKVEESAAMQAQNEVMLINGIADTELASITSSNVYTKLDNQKITTLSNKSGYMIETAVFNAFVPTYHLASLQEIAKKSGLKISAIGSSMYCITKTIMQTNKDLADFIVMEIDGDYTNVAIVFGKGIVATRTLNVGYRHYIEGISERLGLTLTEAERLLRSYCGGKLANSEGIIVQNALNATLDIWMTGIELLFAEYTGVKTFPTKIFVTGEGTGIEDLWTMLTNKQWIKSIPFKSDPEFRKLNFLDINNVSDATGKVASPEWLPTICLSAIYMEMQGETND